MIEVIAPRRNATVEEIPLYKAGARPLCHFLVNPSCELKRVKMTMDMMAWKRKQIMRCTDFPPFAAVSVYRTYHEDTHVFVLCDQEGCCTLADSILKVSSFLNDLENQDNVSVYMRHAERRPHDYVAIVPHPRLSVLPRADTRDRSRYEDHEIRCRP